MADTAASVIARLKSKSKETGKSLQLYLQLFCQEEFLRRVSMSQYADNLVLKGGLFIYTLTNFESRATVDVDFLLRHLPNSTETIQKIVENILAVDTGNDFIVFTSSGFKTISPHRKYNGISFQLIGHIKNTRTAFNLDFGVGDVIVPQSQKRNIPVQLEGFAVPSVMTYSLESTIAEKFDAMLQRLELNSRMKDFFDIYYLSNTYCFDGRLLQQAVSTTLTHRTTPFERDSLDKVAALAYDPVIQARWQLYLRSTKLPGIALEQVLSGIEIFLRPVWDAIVGNDTLLKTWDASTAQWA
jgi:predicted nucleotidyltransferase component of viral defense system